MLETNPNLERSVTIHWYRNEVFSISQLLNENTSTV